MPKAGSWSLPENPILRLDTHGTVALHIRVKHQEAPRYRGCTKGAQ